MMKKLKFLLTASIFLFGLGINAANKSNLTIKVNGQNRSMIIYTPKTMADNYPLMIVTHGMNQSPEYQSVGDAPKYDGGDRLWELCDTAKFVVAYLRSDGNTWDISGDKDINFVNQTIDELSSKYNIDKQRVYWSGFSMGTMLMYHAMATVNKSANAEKLVKRIACFAPTSGMQFSEDPSAALKAKKIKVNLIDHHSKGDGVFPINQYNIKDYVTKIANSNEFTTYFSQNNYTSREGNYKGLKEVWTNTNTGNVVELFMYDGGGHWPSWYNRKEIWNFCKRFSLKTPAEKYNNSYNYAKELVDAWGQNKTISAKTQYKNLVAALDTYAPDNVDASDESALNSAASAIESKVSALEAVTNTYKPNGKLPSQPSEFDPNFHIYLCFGQSNMEGNAPIEPKDRIFVDPRFRMMAAVSMSDMTRVRDSWYVAYPPLCRSGNGLTPADYFGREMVANLPDSISVGVINVSVGGASIKLFDQDICKSYIAGEADWFKNYCASYNNDPYKRLVECARKAQKVGVIKGILLHQGCTDNGQKDWPVKVKRVYTRLLNDLGLNEEETPLLVGELLQQNVGGICYGHNSVIAKIATAIPNAHVISSKDCPAASDGLHFTAEGYRKIGKRYAEKMLELLDKKMDIDFDTTDTYFPFENNVFNPSLCMFGTSRKGGSYLTFNSGGKDGFGGWRYSKGIDLSQYETLTALLFAKPSGMDAKLKIYDTDDYLNPCYSVSIENTKEVVVDLHNMTDDKGNKIDPSHIYLIGFSTNGSKSLYISNMSLAAEESAIDRVALDVNSAESIIYDMTGRRVSSPTSGLYIINGKKTLIR